LPVFLYRLLLTALVVASCSTPSSHFMERSVSVGGRQYRYRVWLPARYTKLHHWPIVLYLHGSGERGDDDTSQLGVGLPPALERYGERYKCVVVIPQCAPDREWYGEMEAYALAALDQSMREFHGDVSRVYLTGVSMGGAGTWYMARHRKRWAAIVPVCGEVARARTDPFPTDPPPDIARIVGSRDPYGTLADMIGRMPVWAFHGANDTVIPPTEARQMVAALRQRKGRVTYTEYPGVGHDCWDRAYAEAEMVQWLLKQKLGK
jgi:predicted peptidase